MRIESCTSAGWFVTRVARRTRWAGLLAVAVLSGSACSESAPAAVTPDPGGAPGEAANPEVARHSVDGADVERSLHPATDAAARSVVIISLDTLRADRLESYGYRRPTSPNIAALGRRAVVFESAQAQSSQTAPSHASLFVSEYGGAHGVINVHGGSSSMRGLPQGAKTLAELAAEHGLETAAFVSGGNLTRGMQMDRGFSLWDERNEDIGLRVKAATNWMLAPGRKPFLLLMHSYQVHAPYLPPREFVESFTDPSYQGPLRERTYRYLELSGAEAWKGAVGPDYWAGMLDYSQDDVRFLSDLYDGEIAYTDRELRPLLEHVLAGQLGAETAVVLLSDHGEEFREHGKYQHDQVYEELLHVPLLIRLPGPLERQGWTGRVSRPVELIDVAPTVADLLGLDWSQTNWEGRSLVPLLRKPQGAVGWPDRPRFSELTIDPGPKLYRTVAWQGWKYIHAHQADLDVTWEWLFHLAEDPGERTNLISSTDPKAIQARGELSRLLEEHRQATLMKADQLGRGSLSEVDEVHREELNQLGYLDGSGKPKR